MVYLIFFLALLIQALGGFGAGLFAIPLLSFFYEPRFIIPPFALVTLALNLIILYETRLHIDLKKITIIIAGSLIGLPPGAFALAFLDQNIIRLLIAAVTFTLGILFLYGFKPHIKETRKNMFVAGIMSGFLSGSAAMGGPPLIFMMMSLRLKKNAFRATLLGSFVFNGVMGNILYLANGLFVPDNVKIALMGILPAIAGTILGIRIKNFLPDDRFEKIAILLVILIGTVGTIRALSLFIK